MTLPPTVALVGADGAGKSTLARRLPSAVDAPTRSMYLGVNLEEPGPMLPTTRLFLALKGRKGRPDLVMPLTESRRESRATLRGAVRTAVIVSEEWFRLLVSRWWRRSGNTVVFDRHVVADYYYHHVSTDRRLPWYERVHGWLLRRYPLPDLTICLDAPAEVLFDRKPESDVEFLAARRQEYLDMADDFAGFVIVDATQAQDAVLAAVVAHVNALTDREMNR